MGDQYFLKASKKGRFVSCSLFAFLLLFVSILVWVLSSVCGVGAYLRMMLTPPKLKFLQESLPNPPWSRRQVVEKQKIRTRSERPQSPKPGRHNHPKQPKYGTSFPNWPGVFCEVEQIQNSKNLSSKFEICTRAARLGLPYLYRTHNS